MTKAEKELALSGSILFTLIWLSFNYDILSWLKTLPMLALIPITFIMLIVLFILVFKIKNDIL